MQHRLDIDGIRAIAVLSVLFYHLTAGLVPFGFLGVDMFFVISGYLVTGIITKQSESSRGFSLIDFYIRRTRRIVPALLLVLAFCCVGAYLLLLPIDLIGFGNSTLATQFFAANFYFWRDADYFSRQAGEKPLLHMWSLGIEEQFYILMPLLLMVALRRSRWTAFWLVAAGIVASFAANVWALQAAKALPAFYLLPTRAWELGTGALLAVVPEQWKVDHRLTGPLAMLGLVLALLGLTDSVRWGTTLPIALPVVLGTALLILAGGMHRGEGTMVARLLACKPLVRVGLVSYSLYLWHWPLIVFARYFLVRDLRPLEQAVVGASAILLAVLSWKFVEQPFRSNRVSAQRLLIIVGTGSVMVAAVAAALILQQGFPQRLNAAAAAVNAAVGTNYRCPLHQYTPFAGYYGCRLGRQEGAVDAVLLGNSHAQMYAPSIDRVLATAGVAGMLMPMNGCKPLLGVNTNPTCLDLFQQTLTDMLQEPSVRIVILAFNWDANVGGVGVDSAHNPVPLSPAAVTAGLDRTIQAVQAAGKRVILIGPLALPGYDVPSVVGRKLAFGRAVTDPLAADKAAFLGRWQRALDHYAAFPNLVLAQPHTIQCAGPACDFFLEGRSLFADDSHMAQAETARFDPIFARAVAQVLTP